MLMPVSKLYHGHVASIIAWKMIRERIVGSELAGQSKVLAEDLSQFRFISHKPQMT
jgi:hypothetical protein